MLFYFVGKEETDVLKKKKKTTHCALISVLPLRNAEGPGTGQIQIPSAVPPTLPLQYRPEAEEEGPCFIITYAVYDFKLYRFILFPFPFLQSKRSHFIRVDS